MAFFDTTWYCNAGDQATTGHYAVIKWAATTAIAAGALRRQLAVPTVNNERVFTCIIAGTTGSTEPAWTLTRGAKTTDNTVTWMEVTGQASLNGDLTNTATWAQVKAVTPAVLGQIIKRSNNVSYQICTTAGAMSASEPTFSDTAGVTTTDTTAVWTSLGPVGNFTGGQAPHARLLSVFATNWFASGHTIYVGNNHAESQGSNMTFSTNSALMAKIICHNASGSYPPAAGDLTTGAKIITTGNFGIYPTMQGSFYFRGITFIAGSGGVSSFLMAIGSTSVTQVQNWYYFDNCSLQTAGTGVAYFQIGNTPNTLSVIIFNNTTFKFGGTNQYIGIAGCQFVWQNTGQVLETGSGVPAVFFQSQANPVMPTIVFEALDLSQLAGVIYSPNALAMTGSLLIKDCKLNAAATITAPISSGMTVQLVRSSA